MTGWRFWIDRGGTFTDVIGVAPDGARVVRKALSRDGDQPGGAALDVIAAVLAEHGARPADVTSVRVGTTIATNALLERRGARVLFAVTKGFADALAIGWQARPDIFARRIVKPAPLPERVIEIVERIGADGTVLVPLDEARARADLAAARADGFEAIAIACLHAWAWPAHEERLAALAAEAGFSQISVSSKMSGLIRFLPRAETAALDAYLTPAIRAWTEGFRAALDPRTECLLMQSSGGLAAPDAFHGRHAVLSGPAGGVVGMAVVARAAGFGQAIGFDMGGTSTDVSHWAGAFERAADPMAAGLRLAVPMLEIHTVAAGGGSICRFAGGRFQVGPQSAGADPGPAAYRRGGPLTVTDCNIALGRVQPDLFPAIFGPDADLPLDRDASLARLADICAEVEAATGARMTPEVAAAGFLAIADQHMADAIARISIRRGHDPAEHGLVAFGGAGGQHACAVADAVGVEAILLHPLAGVLSALGMGLSRREAVAEISVERPLADVDLDALAAGVAGRARAELGEADAACEVTVKLRQDGADSCVEVRKQGSEGLQQQFERIWMQRFGQFDAARRTIVAGLTAVCATGEGETPPPPPAARTGPALAAPVRLFVGGAWCAAPAWRRGDLAEAQTIDGPALVLEDGSTAFIDAGWRGTVQADGALVLRRVAVRDVAEVAAGVDPIRLEVFSNRFMGVAEEMGVALQATAASVNIKERLDFSCAIFDGAGGLVANAPHIPVHLGSMGDSVRAVMAAFAGDMGRGDMFVLNAPHAGGTHLPDITVIAPVFLEGEARPAFWTAARGHHADIGGLTPGSMPPNSTTVADEGVLIEPAPLVRAGRLLEREMRGLLASGPFPARDADRNIADLKAQIAACDRGVAALQDLARRCGGRVTADWMGHVQANAEAEIRNVIRGLSAGAFAAPMDDGSVIRVAIRPDPEAGTVEVDFTGTSSQNPCNFNAPLAVTRAAVLYVFRTLVDAPIPLNEGCLRPIRIIAPEGSMVNPAPGAAVVAGNVETSQIIVDALYGALGVMAASQGTMNNLTFGDAGGQYYETIAGGAGAGPDFNGASAVQTHMTNSRLTDPEVLETRHPVVLEAFSIRKGSGGDGARLGGDGVVRRIRARAPLQAALLANRRTTAPFGLAGGADGAPGAGRVIRSDGRVEVWGATGSADLAPGDAIEIETPGGGGFGHPPGRA
jgi:5-oxoprolinase (ATP-hydrolysing)